MESKTQTPSFTVSLRGYDREEVDLYIDSLAEALGQVEQAEEQNRALLEDMVRLRSRIADLEQRIAADVPKTGAILGERIAILLRSAEETAQDTINRGEARAAELIQQARRELEQAEDEARGIVVRAEEQARRLESSARAESAEIVAEAEQRAAARTHQIEQWAEQVISHTRAEEARMLGEQKTKREQGQAELKELADQRDAVASTIVELRDTLGQALGLVPTPPSKPAAPTETDATVDQAADRAATDSEAEAVADGGPESEVGSGPTAGAEMTEAPAPTVILDDRDGDPASGYPGDLGGEADAPAGNSSELADESDRAADDSEEAGRTDSSADFDDEMPWPHAFRPVDDEDEETRDESDEAEDSTGEMEPLPWTGAAALADADEFETKFDAWVSGATGEPKHFRRL